MTLRNKAATVALIVFFLAGTGAVDRLGHARYVELRKRADDMASTIEKIHKIAHKNRKNIEVLETIKQYEKRHFGEMTHEDKQ